MPYAIVDALGTYGGPETRVLRVIGSRERAKAYVRRNPLYAAVWFSRTGEPWMKKGYSFPLSPRDIEKFDD